VQVFAYATTNVNTGKVHVPATKKIQLAVGETVRADLIPDVSQRMHISDGGTIRPKAAASQVKAQSGVTSRADLASIQKVMVRLHVSTCRE
jgi:hypothetical protein